MLAKVSTKLNIKIEIDGIIHRIMKTMECNEIRREKIMFENALNFGNNGMRLPKSLDWTK